MSDERAGTADPAPDGAGDADDQPRRGGRHRLLWWVGTPVVLVLLGVGAFIAKTVYDINNTPYQTITYEVPEAPTLVARPGETVYRIDPSRSSLTYEIDERFVGRNVSTAKGTTNGIAGDIAVNRDDPSASRAGDIVANIEQFHSDNRLRDARIRSQFLESHRYPLATFTVTSFEGLPATLENGAAVDFTITGDAEVHGVTRPVTWDATGTLEDDAFDVSASTGISLSDFDVKHVSIQGFVSAGDEATITMELRAVDPGKHRIPETIDGPQRKVSTSGGPSFSETIQPIMENHCAECHRPGQVGAVHWELAKAADVTEISEGIATVTETGYMPPWPASDVGVPLAHVNTLTDDQITAIADWAEAGGRLDVPEDTRIEPSETVAESIPREDATLLIDEYTGDWDMENEYRCFVLDPDITEPTFLTGYGFVADQIPILHHAQVFLVSEDQKKNLLADRDGADGKPGWECFGTVDMEGRPATAGFSRRSDQGFAGQSNLVAGWVPGQTPSAFGKDLGFQMDPGDALVLQIHYHHEGDVVADQSGLTVQLDPVDGERRKIRVVNPLAPVEIPCAPGVEAELCDREAAMEDNVRLYGRSGSFVESGLLMLCGQKPDEVAARFDGRVGHSTCMTRVPESGSIISVLGHMHTIGKSFRLTLHPDTPDERVLLDIPVWNFDWQMNYDFIEPLHVEGGDPIRIDCAFDRSLDPNRPAKYIMFADGTEDEMCFGTYALVPDDQSGPED